MTWTDVFTLHWCYWIVEHWIDMLIIIDGSLHPYPFIALHVVHITLPLPLLWSPFLSFSLLIQSSATLAIYAPELQITGKLGRIWPDSNPREYWEITAQTQQVESGPVGPGHRIQTLAETDISIATLQPFPDNSWRNIDGKNSETLFSFSAWTF